MQEKCVYTTVRTFVQIDEKLHHIADGQL